MIQTEINDVRPPGLLLPLQPVAHLTIVHRCTRKYAPAATKRARP